MLALVLSLALAHAQNSTTQVTRFRWPASGQLDLTITKGGQNIAFPTTNLRDAAGESAEMDAGGLHAIVRTYGSFQSVIVGRAGAEGEMILLERKNSAVEAISDPIPGRFSEMPDQLQYVIKRYAELQKSDPADVSGCFRSMVAYFDTHPGKQMDAYVLEAERGTDIVKLTPKPMTRVTEAPGGPTTGPAPAAPPPATRSPAPAPAPRPRPTPRPRYYDEDPYYNGPRRQQVPPGYYQQPRQLPPQQQQNPFDPFGFFR